MKNNKYIILGFILIIASFLRLYSLTMVPPSASLDEASIGWNAYSILQTGKDEYGKAFPILLRAYDDYRPALYVYAVIPFVKLLGLNILAVRFPSVIFSILTVFATYFLVKEIFKKQNIVNNEHLALLSCFLLAISPWHIYVSRLGHEVNLGLSFFIFSLLFFLKKRIYLSTLFLLISFISYQSEKIFIPVVILGIFIIFKNEIWEMRKKILISLIFSLIILTPFIKETLSPSALIRFQGTNIFDYNKSRFDDTSILLAKAKRDNDLIGTVLYNRRILSLQIISEAYLANFNPAWLFTNASGDRHKIPNIGLIYIWELPFIIIGILVLIRLNFDPKIKKLILLWLLASPLAASIATDSPHALRTFTFLPTWQIFSSLGLIAFFNTLKTKTTRKLFLAVFTIVVFFSLEYLYRQYFYVFRIEQTASFQYSISQAIPFVLKNENSYKKVIFSNRDSLFQSYMFFLFYGKYDPFLYQKEGGTLSGGYSQVHKFGKYEFRPLDLPTEKTDNLYIGNYSEFFNNENKLYTPVEPLKIIRNLKGENKIVIATKREINK